MRVVYQRVKEAYVKVNETKIAQIGKGALILLGVEDGDTEKDAQYLAEKCVLLRIFEDEEGKMNLSLKDVGGALLAVSQFTLCADCKKGRRPSFVTAASPDEAKRLYDFFAQEVEKQGICVQKGQFQAHMEVGLINDGPVTILLDSKKTF